MGLAPGAGPSSRATHCSRSGLRDEMVRNAPPDTEFEAGDRVEFVAPNGGRYSGVLKTLRDDAALFDFNHPLAGVDLQVECKILGVL